MSDWRSGDSNKRKPKPIRSDGEVPKLSPQPTGGWKGKGAKSASPKSTAPTRTWKGQVNEADALTASALRKWITIGALSLAAFLFTGFFIVTAFNKSPKLPLFVFAVKDYDSKELLENPFAAEQRKAIYKANVKNIHAEMLLSKSNFATGEEDDNALSSLENSEWAQKFKQIGGKVIKPGGPSERVVAIYINAYAVFSPTNDLVLYTQKENPFVKDSSPGIKLESIFSNVAACVPKNAIAWIILDLQLPPVTANLINLSPPWRASAERALANLEKDKLSKLLVTLPGDDGQQNWIAPEYSSSFFGHYVLQLLEGHFAKKRIIDSELTIGEFRDLLDETVSSQVNNRRFAQQNPLWLPAENAEKARNVSLVAIPKEKTPEEALKSQLVESHLNAINSHWERLTQKKFRRAYRWDPIGYGKAESLLLALEETAFSRPSSFDEASKLFEDALSAIKKPEVEFQVSLIEDRARNLYFHDDKGKYEKMDALVQMLLDNLSKPDEVVPDFWKTPPQIESADKAPSPEMALPMGERSIFVWQLFSSAAKRQQDDLWKKVFTSQRINSALDFCGNADGDWLEINLLRRLAKNIDWGLLVADRPTACAKAIDSFDRLQSLATQVEPEVSSWLEPNKMAVEKQFLLGFDHLLANQAKDALEVFSSERVDGELRRLAARMSELNQVVTDMHETLHHAPHLLATLLREYQFSKDVGAVEDNLSKLGVLVREVEQTYELLATTSSRNDDGLDRILKAGSNIHSRLNAFQADFAAYVENQTDARATSKASNSPQTFRRNRIALLSPLLNFEYRSVLYKRVATFLSEKTTEGTGDVDSKSTVERNVSVGASKFLDGLGPDSRKLWDQIVNYDVRLGWAPVRDQLERKTIDGSSLPSELFKPDYWLRSFAAACGANPSQKDFLENNHAFDLWQLSTAHYQCYQVRRLAEASWGNGEYTQNSRHDEFYFFVQAEKYRKRFDAATSDVISRPVDALRKEMQQALESAVARLKSLQVAFGNSNQSIDNSQDPINVNVTIANPWNGVAQVYLRDVQGKRLAWLSRKPEDRAWAVDLNQEKRQTKKQFDVGYWKSSSQPPWGDISLRGNFRSKKLDWKVSEQETMAIQLAMKRDTPKPATLQVIPPAKKPPITVLILIDCSQSMEMKVKRISEGGGVIEEPLFELVKGDVSRVLESLAQVHGRDAEVKAGIIPFGLSNKDFPSEFKSAYLIAPENQIHRPKAIGLLDENGLRSMKTLVQRLKPSGETPLYEAINVAYQATPDQTSLVFVFSDGVNYVTNKSLKLTSVDDLRQQIDKNSKVRLSVFHYDFFKPWVEDKENEAFWRKVYDKGKSELVSLGSLANAKYGSYSLDEWDKLQRDSLAFIPRPLVSVASTSSTTGKVFKTDAQKLDSIIDIDQQFLPADLLVDVNGPFGSASTKITAYGGEQLKLYYNVDGGINRLALEKFNSKGTMPPFKPTGGRLRSQIYLRPFPKRSTSSYELGFELDFWNEQNPDEFTQRPKFIVGELSESDNPNGGTFLLADHRFLPATHYPEARLSDVPWPSGNPPPAAKLKIWASDTFPNLQKIDVGKKNLKLGIANISQIVDGNKVTAEVNYSASPQAKDRVVIVCPNFESSVRTFYAQQSYEKHEFFMPEDLPSYSGQLHFTTVGELDAMVESNEISRFIFDSIEIR